MATQFKHKYAEFGFNTLHKRVKDMIDMKDQVDVDRAHVKFSYGNRKTGKMVPSVSLIPIHDCANCKVCCQGCYDIRNVCFQKTVQKSRANNSALYERDPMRFMFEVEQEVKFRSFFRFFVGGDLKDYYMLDSIVGMAYRNPQCQILMFTKMYSLVNKYLDDHSDIKGGVFPDNLHIIFSDWRGAEFENPYNLPVSSPLWEDGTKGPHCTDDTIICTGDCSACAEIKGGCWSLKKGQTVLFEAH